MLTYWLLNLQFLIAAVLVLLVSLLARRAPSGRAVGAAAVITLVLTAIFDNVLVGTGIVAYDVALTSGRTIGVAPIEDFAYTIGAIVLLPALWAMLGGPRASVHTSPEDPQGTPVVPGPASASGRDLRRSDAPGREGEA